MSREVCPPPEALCAFVNGDLSEARLDEMGEHLQSCPACQNQLALLDDLTDPIIVDLRRGVPVRFAGSTLEERHPAGVNSAKLPEQLDDFRIIREIARGGMGVVCEAYQGSLNRHVALKMLPERGDPARFRREAKAAGRLHHTNIVPVFGVGEHQGRHFYVMQFIAGRGLNDLLKERRTAGDRAAVTAIDHREAARIALQVAEALAYAHAQGVIHRDIKPSNLLLDAQGTVWITDFGLAYDAADTETLTDTGEFLGTLRYAAPERISERGDARADVYGLGVTLYELVCGRPPFAEADRAALLNQILHHDPLRPRHHDPRVPRDLETIVLKSMAREPAHRYVTASDLAQDLRRFLEDRPIRGRRVSAWERMVRWCRSNPATAGLAGGFILALIVGTTAASYFAIRATRGETAALENARRADREATRVREEKRLSDRLLYVAEMHLAQQAWEDNRPDLVRQRLREFVPERPDETDPRGFEWFYLQRLCQFGARTLHGHAYHVTSAAYSPDGRILASAGVDGNVILWESATGRMVRVLTGHAAKVEIDTLAFRPDGRTLASASIDGTVRVWDTATGQRLWILRGHTDAVSGAAYSPDGRTLATGGHDHTVRLWDADTGRELRTLRGHTGPIYSLAYRPDGRTLFSASGDHTLKLWDAETGREVRTLRGHSGVVRSLALSLDGRTLASASWDQTIKLWDAVTGREIRTLRGHKGPLTGVAFGPEGKRIASVAWDGSLRLWDSVTGEELLTLRGHSRSEVNGVAYSPDGRDIASVGWDGAIKLWDVATGLEVVDLSGHEDQVLNVAFSPDGRMLATASGDLTVKLWNATPLTPELQVVREARSVVEFLFARPLPIAEVLDRIRSDAALTPEVRRRALELAEPYGHSLVVQEAERLVESLYATAMFRPEVLASLRRDAALSEPVRQEALMLAERVPENPLSLQTASWSVSRRADADASAYRLAMRQAEAACRLIPNDEGLQEALGVAQYRVGLYRDAVATLTRADPLRAALVGEPTPAELAFLALSQHRLGRIDQARATLGRLRELMKKPERARSEQDQNFLREAEALVADLAFPADPFAP